MRRTLAALALLAFGLAAGAAEVRAVEVRAVEVNVYAAASLTDALQEVARGYERTSRDRIVFQFAASSTLARQIEQGAPADLFLSADELKMDVLAAKGLIDRASRVSVLSNTLVIVVPATGGQRLNGPRDLTQRRFASIAIAEPSSVPAGIYARTYLTRLGIWKAIARKVIPTDNVRAALAAVASGNVDAAVVYRTDARTATRVRIAYEVPRAAGPVISYPFALAASSEHPAEARRFLAYLRSNAAREVFVRHGFLLR
ncbi:MAG: molybdate transport system substrate-binding protein [Acidobacteriota bacterium]|jgi:molybdate transport system substrate-binding protein|nr:molybdate transport system substrate-binding protein [Acidobacteriota bacterium]